MNSYITRGQAENRTQLREKFLSNVLSIIGDTRLLWTPKPTDTTTSLDESLTGRILTHDATIAARLQALGLGYFTTFNGTTQFATSPDTANLTFGSGAADSPFSGAALVNVTDTAALRVLLAKFEASGSGNGAEYSWSVNASDQLQLNLYDNSVPVSPNRASNSAITQGSWVLLGFTYDGTGGATAMNGCTLYQNGVVIASTATNNGAYVAMEDKPAEFSIGANTIHTANFLQGSGAFMALSAVAWNASDHWALKKALNAYFGLAL